MGMIDPNDPRSVAKLKWFILVIVGCLIFWAVVIGLFVCIGTTIGGNDG